MFHIPYDADQRNETHEYDPKAIEHRLSVATDAMKEWADRNAELRRQNREKNELIVQLRKVLRDLVIETCQIPVDWTVEYAKEQAERTGRVVDKANKLLTACEP